MPWSNQSGGGSGGGGGPRRGGNGGSGGGGGPWGQGSGGGGGQPPDLEDILKRGQDKMKNMMGGGGGGRIPGPLFLLLAAAGVAFIAWHAFFFQVGPQQQGVVLRFGKYHHWEPAGLHFRWPYPVEEVLYPEVERQKKLTIPETGSAGSGPAESLMLTGDENIVDVAFTVFWQIRKADDYLFNTYPPDQIVKDVAESAMREMVGRSKVDDVLAPGRGPIEQGVKELMQAMLDAYKTGVVVKEVQIQQAQAPEPVRKSFSDVVAANQDRDRAQNEAQKFANQVIPEARGSAQQIIKEAEAYKAEKIAEAQGQTARFLSVYEEYRKAPEVTRKRMFFETMERVFAGTDKMILDNKGGQGVVPFLPLDQLQKKKPEGVK